MAVKITEGWPAAVNNITGLSEGEIISLKTDRLELVDLYFKQRIIGSFSRSLSQWLICTSFMEILEPDICDYVLMITYSKSILDWMLRRNCFLYNESCGGYRLHFLFRSFLLRRFDSSGGIDKSRLYSRYADCIVNRGRASEAFDFYLLACCRDKAWQITNFYEFGAEEYARTILRRLPVPNKSEDSGTEFTLKSCQSRAEFKRQVPTPTFIEKSSVEQSLKSWQNCARIKRQVPMDSEEDLNGMLMLAWAHYALEGVKGMDFWLSRYDCLKESPTSEHKNASDALLYIFVKILRPKQNPRKTIDVLKNATIPLDISPLPLITMTLNMPSIFRGAIDVSQALPDIDLFVKDLRLSAKNILGRTYEILEDILLAEAAYESNNVAKSLEIIQRAADKCDTACRSEIHFAALCQLCVIQCALKQKSKCSEIMEAIGEMISYKKAFFLNDNFEALRVRIKIRQGETTPAETWLSVHAAAGASDAKALPFIGLFSHFATASSLIRAKKYDEAIVFLKRLESLCKEYGRTIDLAEIYILKSIAYSKTRDLELSRKSMAAALSIGYSYGFIRIFLDNGDITEILEPLTGKESKHLKCNIRYVKKLIYLLKTLRLSPGGIANELKSIKLSARQQYMLIYLSQDLTYSEICQKSNLKITTVRTHISNLYRKLDATHKKEALEKAVALGFIDAPP